MDFMIGIGVLLLTIAWFRRYHHVFVAVIKGSPEEATSLEESPKDSPISLDECHEFGWALARTADLIEQLEAEDRRRR